MAADHDEMGPCPKCGSDHEGYQVGTYGAEMRCLRVQAETLGALHLIDQIDTMERERQASIEAALSGRSGDV